MDRAGDARSSDGVKRWVRTAVCIPKPILLHRKPLRMAFEILKSVLLGRPYVVSKFASRRMSAAVAEAVGRCRYDAVVVDHLQMFMYAPLKFLGERGIPLVLEEHNVETAIVRRYRDAVANPAVKIFAAFELWKLGRFEKRACLASQTVLAITSYDAREIREWTDRGHDVRVSPFFVEPREGAPRKAVQMGTPPRILFVGTMSWFPNADGAVWFYDRVFRLLRARHPGLVFDIVGRDPGPRLERLRADAAVRLTGRVDDTAPYLDAADAAVVPLRVGGGLRIKILELLAAGVPLVTTTVGCEGIPVTHERELLIADGEEAFGQAVSRLLSDEVLRRTLSENAVRFVREKYSFDAALAFYKDLFGHK